MENELSLLEGKVEQLLRLLTRAREENAQLNEKLLTRDAEIGQLQAKVNEARMRLEQLVNQIPEDADEDIANEGASA